VEVEKSELVPYNDTCADGGCLLIVRQGDGVHGAYVDYDGVLDKRARLNVSWPSARMDTGSRMSNRLSLQR
jgi:hypothetical protein